MELLLDIKTTFLFSQKWVAVSPALVDVSRPYDVCPTPNATVMVLTDVEVHSGQKAFNHKYGHLSQI